jgi:hypothetical protein
MEFSAFGVVQIAVGVFTGNLMAFAVLKGAQVLKDDSPWWRIMAPAVPAIVAVLVLIGSTD